MSDTRWDLRRIEDRHSEEEARTVAVRRARRRAALVDATDHDSARLPRRSPDGWLAGTVDVTAEIPVVLRHSSGGCRTKVDGVRCRHDQPSHYEVGHSGWRMRCRGCPCTTWRAPFSEPVGDAAIGLGVALILVLLFWFAVVPALIEMMT